MANITVEQLKKLIEVVAEGETNIVDASANLDGGPKLRVVTKEEQVYKLRGSCSGGVVSVDMLMDSGHTISFSLLETKDGNIDLIVNNKHVDDSEARLMTFCKDGQVLRYTRGEDDENSDNS